MGITEQLESSGKDNGAAIGDLVPAKMFVPYAPALLHNSKGLPIRLVGSAQFFELTSNCYLQQQIAIGWYLNFYYCDSNFDYKLVCII